MTVKELLNYQISVNTDTILYDCYYFYCEKDYLQLCKNKNFAHFDGCGKYFSFVVFKDLNKKVVIQKNFLENEV